LIFQTDHAKLKKLWSVCFERNYLSCINYSAPPRPQRVNVCSQQFRRRQALA